MRNSKICKADLKRMPNHDLYYYFLIRWLRKAQESHFKPVKNIYRLLFRHHSLKHGIEILTSTKIGPGFCLWHPYNITIAQETLIGKNVTINKGCLMGREFRGKRHGAPIIGDNVWIGANASIVGKVTIGNNVLIAPNTYVNCDIPSNSIVFGNPCIIKHSNNPVVGYIQNIY